ncbi:AT-rich interactive domain-containing protein 5A [Austrofundulus limnaeus]|uniref:AT-rich interactive domain-containing protein 5A n=1 Tax=Austrofundulus limnaeus TaxID=52670 RepID=A0A2I4BII4_AUSLI|nr:PREDICTED: AT-rich interactive domain-containing protein 5B-like [Austrofundulus limnaeus]
MAEEDQSETSQQTAASDEESARAKQASSCVVEIHDLTTERGKEAGPDQVQMEEKTFVSCLHTFMKDKGSPIERIPHLGFKQIDLWMIYKVVEKLGGYESVTTRRLWKKVYDELGGSPGSTSAATCTRRHYERLVLPFERHLKGEDDKPLPLSKPRKPYKRSMESKINKADGKRKMTHSERELDSELLAQRSPDTARTSEAMMHSHFALWGTNSDRRHKDHSKQNRTTGDFCTSVSDRILQGPEFSTWGAHLPYVTGEVISPLEKKKRMAQASLSSQREDKKRPSVIQCSLSPVRLSPSRQGNSSDGSPLPLSSSSSRSSSPLSVSSEDTPAGSVTEPAPSSASPENSSSTTKVNKDKKSVSCDQTATNPAGQAKDVSQGSAQSLYADSVKTQLKESAWKLYPKVAGKHFMSIPTSFAPSSSSFSKVIPKSGQLLRPAPIHPSPKILTGRPLQQSTSLTCAKKAGSVIPWQYLTEKRDRSRTMAPKIPPTQQSLSQSNSAPALPASCVLTSYDKSGRDSRHQHLVHPAFLPHRMRLPQSQLMYPHIPVGPSQSTVIGPAFYPYHYPFHMLNPQVGYSLPAMNPIYPHKL